MGRRGRDYFGRRGFEVRYEQVNLFAALKFADAQAMAKTAIEAFIDGEVDSVYLVYNEFKSVMQQRVVVERLLPIPRRRVQRAGAPAAAPAGRLPVRAGAGGAVHAPAFRATSRCRCTARCSNRRPPITPRG